MMKSNITNQVAVVGAAGDCGCAVIIVGDEKKHISCIDDAVVCSGRVDPI